MRMPVLAALTLVIAVAVAVSPAWGAQGSRFRPAVSGQLGVVATESPAAARVGRRALERGGNAVDAAVSTVFALNVARPQSCGIGGGGFMVYRGAYGQTAALDFRETAPQAFTPDTLQGPGLHNTFTGHLTVGVPGTLAGMDAALKRYGTFSLARAIAPAVRLASRGVRVTPALSESMSENASRLKLSRPPRTSTWWAARPPIRPAHCCASPCWRAPCARSRGAARGPCTAAGSRA